VNLSEHWRNRQGDTLASVASFGCEIDKRARQKPRSFVHPALHNANLSALVTGDRVSLTVAHAKVRRDGYRRAHRAVDQSRW